MTKELKDMKLSELLELKTAADTVSEHYANELTTYATVNYDPYLKNMSNVEKEKYEKRIVSQNLAKRIFNEIESRISEFY